MELNEINMDDVISKLRKWLGEDGISFFRKVKKQFGRIDACWAEGEFDDGSEEITELRKQLKQSQHPPIPHPVHFREGMYVRNFLRTIYGDKWTAHDYDNRWAALVEEAICDEETHHEQCSCPKCLYEFYNPEHSALQAARKVHENPRSD